MMARVVAVLNNVSSARLVGAAGLVVIIAPLPSLEGLVFPIIFVATTFA